MKIARWGCPLRAPLFALGCPPFSTAAGLRLGGGGLAVATFLRATFESFCIGSFYARSFCKSIASYHPSARNRGAIATGGELATTIGESVPFNLTRGAMEIRRQPLAGINDWIAILEENDIPSCRVNRRYGHEIRIHGGLSQPAPMAPTR